jgi:hypothetical protein
VIIWINGAYTAGKSTIAAELVKQRPEALLYDPEPLGYYLRDTVKPAERARDYQELAIFAPVVVEVARQLYGYGRSLVMPLGIWRPAQFAEIHSGLEQIGPVKHYCLTATRATINRRLLYRGDGQQAQRWIRERLEDCLEAQAAPQFAQHITTDDLTPGEIAEQIREDMEASK